jgi:hypothetical protein
MQGTLPVTRTNINPKSKLMVIGFMNEIQRFSTSIAKRLR